MNDAKVKIQTTVRDVPPVYMTSKKTNNLSSVKSHQVTGAFGEILLYTGNELADL